MMLVGMGGLVFLDSEMMIYVCIALIGFGNSNVFPIIFSQALLNQPEKKNEVSGLMIMGLFGGTVFPMAMGYATQLMNNLQIGAVLVMLIGIIYLLYYTFNIRK